MNTPLATPTSTPRKSREALKVLVVDDDPFQVLLAEVEGAVEGLCGSEMVPAHGCTRSASQ